MEVSDKRDHMTAVLMEVGDNYQDMNSDDGMNVYNHVIEFLQAPESIDQEAAEDGQVEKPTLA